MPALFRRLWPFMRADRRLALVAAALALAALPLAAVPPFLVKYLFDDVIGRGDAPTLVRIVAVLCALALLAAALSYLQQVVSLRLRTRFRYRVTRRLFRHVLRLPVAFFDRSQTGHLMTRLRDDVAALDGLRIDRLAVSAIQALKAVVFLVLLFLLDAGLALSGLVLVLAIFGSSLLFAPALRRRSRRGRETDADSSAMLHEILSGVRHVKVASREGAEQRRFGARLGAHLRAAFRRDVLGRASSSTVGLVGNLGVYLLIGIAAYRILQGWSTVGSLLGFFTLLTQLVGSAGALFGLMPAIQAAAVAGERALDLLGEAPEARGGLRRPAAPRPRGKLELRDVRFRYDGGDEVLHGIDLVARPGETVALVGRSGSGKTTLLRLVTRLYEPTGGAVLLDDRDLRDLPLSELRRRVGVVSQDIFLFNRSVFENIAYAVDDPDPETVHEAARAAQCDEFIRALPEGYDSVVGERGVRLSGGQKQRIAIARELLRDPPLLLLDEATSHLDSESEARVQVALDRLVEGRTCLVAAHRLSTLRNADRVLVIDGGHIVERGTPDELRSTGGLYSQLLELQTLESAEPPVPATASGDAR